MAPLPMGADVIDGKSFNYRTLFLNVNCETNLRKEATTFQSRTSRNKIKAIQNDQEQDEGVVVLLDET